MMGDEELERIKMRKMMELLRGNKGQSRGETPSHPIEITDENFEEFVSSHPLVVVDFWAEWCMPCRMIAPIVEELASDLRGKVVFGKLNVDENPLTTSRYGIMSIPTLLIFKDGKPVDAIIGATSKSKILSRLNNYIS